MKLEHTFHSATQSSMLCCRNPGLTAQDPGTVGNRPTHCSTCHSKLHECISIDLFCFTISALAGPKFCTKPSDLCCPAMLNFEASLYFSDGKGQYMKKSCVQSEELQEQDSPHDTAPLRQSISASRFNKAQKIQPAGNYARVEQSMLVPTACSLAYRVWREHGYLSIPS